jgi:hypothetical protein
MKTFMDYVHLAPSPVNFREVSLLENAGGHDFWLAYPPLIPSLADSDEASGHIVRCLMEKTWCQGTECGIWQQPAGTQGYPS